MNVMTTKRNRWGGAMLVVAICLATTACPAPSVEDEEVKVVRNPDGTFTATGPPGTCLEFTDSEGESVGDSHEIGRNGYVTAPVRPGAFGWTIATCEDAELVFGHSVSGGSGGATNGISMPAMIPLNERSRSYEIVGSAVDPEELRHGMYRLRVAARSLASARSAAATYALSLMIDPHGAAPPPPSIEIIYLTVNAVGAGPLPGSRSACVFGLAEQPFTDWEVTVDDAVLLGPSQVQLGNGLWFSISHVPFGLVDTFATGDTSVEARFKHPDCGSFRFTRTTYVHL